MDENWEGVVKGLHKKKSKQSVQRFINWYYDIHRQTDRQTWSLHKTFIFTLQTTPNNSE